MYDELEDIIRELNSSCHIGEYRDRIIELFKNKDGEKDQVENFINIRPIRFYCQQCGKELFEDMNYNDYKKDTLEYYLLHATKKCSDCLLKDIQKTH